MSTKNMELCHAMMLACVNVSKLLVKNQYYTHDDMQHAMTLACDVLYKNKNINLLKIGNHKLHNNTMIFDMPSIITCKYACPSCYALKAERIYKNTRISSETKHYLLTKLSNI